MFGELYHLAVAKLLLPSIITMATDPVVEDANDDLNFNDCLNPFEDKDRISRCEEEHNRYHLFILHR